MYVVISDPRSTQRVLQSHRSKTRIIAHENKVTSRLSQYKNLSIYLFLYIYIYIYNIYYIYYIVYGMYVIYRMYIMQLLRNVTLNVVLKMLESQNVDHRLKAI